MEWKWMCNICKKIVPNTKELMLHVFFEHQQAIHYGTPIATDTLPVPQKAAPKLAATKPKPKVKRRVIEEEPEEELEEEEDLSLD